MNKLVNVKVLKDSYLKGEKDTTTVYRKRGDVCKLTEADVIKFNKSTQQGDLFEVITSKVVVTNVPKPVKKEVKKVEVIAKPVKKEIKPKKEIKDKK